MANYIGQAPINGFHAKQSLTGDGSTTTFTLDQTVASESSILVSVGGVLQEPSVAYNLAEGGTKITFTEAPSSTDTAYIHFLGKAIVQNVNDVNGAEFILDADADTSFTADTDDEIDIKVGGSDRSTIKATGFHNLDSIKFVAGTGDDMQMYHDGSNSYLTNSTGALKIATETSGIAITLGHTTSEVTVADNMTVAGDLTVSGTASFADANITNVGSIALDTITNDGTDVTIDSSGDIILDAGGADILIKDDATEIGRFTNSSSDLVLKSSVSDKDLIFQGNDGGSTITALTLDMSAAGAATFNDKITAVGTSVFTNLDISGDIDVDGTTNLDVVDIDGAVQLDATLTIGANDQGYDVILYGDTASANVTWDTSADDLIFNGAAGLIVPDGQLTLGSTAVTSTAAELNLLDTASANSVVNSKAVIYGSSGELAGTLSTAAQTNITSLGTLTALTVDDVAVNGKVITMTGSSSDTAVFTAGTNGTLDIVTTDAGGAAANIQITADGTAELAGTTVTLDSSGGITLDADGGTITFADGGSSLGTITSSGYSGTAAAATTVTVTDNESTNENNVLVFVAGADSDGGTGLGLESDGNLTYNPSTGTLSATNLVVSGTQTITNSVTMNANNAVVFEGSTADDHETTLSSIDATADRTINLPNVSGTLPVLASVSAVAITSTPTELNVMDGGTSATSTTVADADRVVMNDNGTMVQVAVTDLAAYFDDEITAMPNLTSVGTLTALTVDDVAINGKVITMTGSTDDTAVFTVAANGALTLETTDTAAAAANIQITADGTFEVDATTVTLDSSGDIILDADGGDVIFKDAGTTIGQMTNSSSDFVLTSVVQDKDMIFKGDDGGAAITALTLDMSAAGAATFNNDVTAFSDARLKDNVETIPNALEKVCAMRGVNFTRNDNNDQPGTGVIAQEMQEVFPVVVKENNDEDNTLSVSYGNLVGVLIESIKELKAEIDELKGN